MGHGGRFQVSGVGGQLGTKDYAPGTFEFGIWDFGLRIDERRKAQSAGQTAIGKLVESSNGKNRKSRRNRRSRRSPPVQRLEHVSSKFQVSSFKFQVLSLDLRMNGFTAHGLLLTAYCSLH
jgi:hypothetical protein